MQKSEYLKKSELGQKLTQRPNYETYKFADNYFSSYQGSLLVSELWYKIREMRNRTQHYPRNNFELYLDKNKKVTRNQSVEFTYEYPVI